MTPTKTPEKVETVMDALESAPETKALHLARLKWAVIDHWLPDNPTIEQRLNRCLAEPKKMIWHAIDLERDRDQLRARVSELEAENARLRLAAIADAKDHDRRVSECERWADRLAQAEQQRDAATEALKRARVAIEQILAAYKLGGGFALVEAIQTEIARQDAAAALAAAETDK